MSHSDTDHFIYSVRTSRLAIPIQTTHFKKKRSAVLGVPKEMIHKEVPALLMLNLHGLYELSDMVKTTDVTIMEEF